MQEITLKQWHDFLGQKLSQTCEVLAETVHEAAVRDGEGRIEIAEACEYALDSLERAAEKLQRLRRATNAAEIVRSLESLNINASSAKRSFGIWPGSAKTSERLVPELQEQVSKCREALANFSAETNRLLELPEVTESRLSYRAEVAKETSRKIALSVESSVD